MYITNIAGNGCAVNYLPFIEKEHVAEAYLSRPYLSPAPTPAY